METFRLITSHPLNQARPWAGLGRFALWQLRSRIAPGDHLVPWVNGVKLRARAGETGITGNIYCGLHEVHDMGFLLHALGPDDLFVDVGANAGAYALLASGARGAKTVAFEPIPATFERLRGNIAANQLEARVDARNLGLADQPGSLRFTTRLNCVNHVATAADSAEECAEIPVTTLDDALGGLVPALIKVDVEGFEAPVLRGASRTLAAPGLLALILETNQSETRYGLAADGVPGILAAHGFRAMSYDPFARRLSALPPAGGKRDGNTIFVRAEDELRRRLQNAPPFSVQGHRI